MIVIKTVLSSICLLHKYIIVSDKHVSSWSQDWKCMCQSRGTPKNFQTGRFW